MDTLFENNPTKFNTNPYIEIPEGSKMKCYVEKNVRKGYSRFKMFVEGNKIHRNSPHSSEKFHFGALLPLRVARYKRNY